MTKNTTLFLFFTAKILANLAAYAFLPILPLYLADQRADTVQIGLFFSALALARLGLGITGGWLADTVGHLRGLALGSLSGVLAFLVILQAPSWHWTLAGMVLIYIASSLTTPTQSAFIAGFITKNRGKAFGLMNTTQAISTTAAPLLGGWLVSIGGFETLFKVAGGLYVVAAVIRFALTRKVPDTSGGRALKLREFGESIGELRLLITAGGVLAWMLALDAFDDVARTLTEIYQPLFLEGAGITILQIGAIGSLASGATIISHSISGWLVDKRGERAPLVLASALAGAAAILFVFAGSFAGYAIVWFFIGLTAGLGTTAFDSLISKVVPKNRRGLAYGLFSTAQGLFSLPVPLIGAWLFSTHNHLPFYVAGVASLLGAWVAWRKFPAGVIPDRSEAGPEPTAAAKGASA